MTGGEITGNRANTGGVYLLWGVTFDMTGGEITSNRANVADGLLQFGDLYGNPSIGSKVNGKGSIYGNTPDNIIPAR
jgi:hypothetical protein